MIMLSLLAIHTVRFSKTERILIKSKLFLATPTNSRLTKSELDIDLLITFPTSTEKNLLSIGICMSLIQMGMFQYHCITALKTEPN
jgi:hypothetical protein